MKVNYLPPSEMDATIEATGGHRFSISPRFYSKNGSVIIGMLVSSGSSDVALDRVVLGVSSKGRIVITHRNEEVLPSVEHAASVSVPEASTGSISKGIKDGK